MPRKVLLSAVIALSAAPSVFADQCAVLSRSQASAFLAQVSVGDYIGSLCEPCGESAENGPALSLVESIGIQRWESLSGSGEDLVQVLVNGNPIDLAYTYILRNDVENGATKAVNAAYIAGCPASDVSTELTLPAETCGL